MIPLQLPPTNTPTKLSGVKRRRALPMASTAAAIGLVGCASFPNNASAPTTDAQDAQRKVQAYTSDIEMALDKVDQERLRASADKKRNPAAGGGTMVATVTGIPVVSPPVVNATTTTPPLFKTSPTIVTVTTQPLAMALQPVPVKGDGPDGETDPGTPIELNAVPGPVATPIVTTATNPPPKPTVTAGLPSPVTMAGSPNASSMAPSIKAPPPEVKTVPVTEAKTPAAAEAKVTAVSPAGESAAASIPETKGAPVVETKAQPVIEVKLVEDGKGGKSGSPQYRFVSHEPLPFMPSSPMDGYAVAMLAGSGEPVVPAGSSSRDTVSASSVAANGAMTALPPPPPPAPPEPVKVEVPVPADPTVDDAMALLRKTVSEHPNLNTALAMALLDTGKNSDLLKNLSESDQKLAGDLLAALEAMKTAAPGQSLAERATPIVDATKKWEKESDLTLPKMVLATRVDSFGVYTLAETTFEQGKRHTVILYCEVANFASKKSDDGWNTTQLSQQETLSTEDGLLVWRPNPEEVEDKSMNQRHDFYLVKKLVLPETLANGRYTLQMSVKDEVSGKHATVEMQIEIGSTKLLTQGG